MPDPLPLSDEPEVLPPDAPPPEIADTTPSTAVLRLSNCDKMPLPSSTRENVLNWLRAPKSPLTEPSESNPKASDTDWISKISESNDVFIELSSN